MSASEYSTAVGGKDNTLGPENVGSGSIKFSQILGGDSNELKGVFSSTIVGGRLNSKSPHRLLAIINKIVINSITKVGL